jgi:hypothetical protein
MRYSIAKDLTSTKNNIELKYPIDKVKFSKGTSNNLKLGLTKKAVNRGSI